MKNKFVFIGTLFIFIIVCTVNIGYSAFSTSLSISGDAFVRVDADIRITNLELFDIKNGGSEVFNSSFSKNLTSMSVRLPNVNSSVTYKVTVTNKTNKYFSPNEISKQIITNEGNVSYKLDGIESYGIYQGNNLVFYITFTTSLANQEMNLTLSYDFKTVDSETWTYSYSGEGKLFTVPYSGKYLIELWGASGGIYDDFPSFSKGGYTKGVISLKAFDKIYVYVGEKGIVNTRNSTFNGGGSGGIANQNGTSGGGATDVRLISGNWDNLDSLKSRIMVAAGGGGSAYDMYTWTGEGSYAGGLTGFGGGYYPGHTYVNQEGKGGTQTSGGAAGNNHYGAVGTVYSGSFGIGGSCDATSHGRGSGGGGGGYYGGGAGGATMSGGYGQGGGGGSSFISGYLGCVAIKSSSDMTPKCSIDAASSDVSCSYHYSNYKFTNALMIAGNSEMTSPTGVIEAGHVGDGYAKITLYLE